MLSAQDDKPFLLLTRLVLTATGAPAAVATAATELEGTGYYSAISAAVSAAATKAAGSTGGSGSGGLGVVRWSDAADMAGPGDVDAGVMSPPPPSANGFGSADGQAAAAAAAASACVRDPVLLCELLEWSSTRVKLALQRLLEPASEGVLVFLCFKGGRGSGMHA